MNAPSGVLIAHRYNLTLHSSSVGNVEQAANPEQQGTYTLYTRSLTNTHSISLSPTHTHTHIHTHTQTHTHTHTLSLSLSLSPSPSYVPSHYTHSHSLKDAQSFALFLCHMDPHTPHTHTHTHTHTLAEFAEIESGRKRSLRELRLDGLYYPEQRSY